VEAIMRKVYYFLFHGVLFAALLFILFFREVTTEFVIAALICGFNLIRGFFPKTTGEFTHREKPAGRFIRLINYTIRLKNRESQEAEIADIRNIERVNVNSVISTILLTLVLLISDVFVDTFTYLEYYDWLPIVFLLAPYFFFAGRYILFDKPSIEYNEGEDPYYVKEGTLTFAKGLAFISFLFGFFMLFFIRDGLALLSEGTSRMHRIYSMGVLGVPMILMVGSWGYTLIYFFFIRK
jgi:hypothetical protein